MTVVLTLGGVVFEGFEEPEGLPSGGEQMLAVHKMPGGTRTIDAMGPDDADIHWNGRFRGEGAEERAMLLDYMRRSGQQLLLSYSLHRYQVVIKEFTANFQQPFEIPYTISCMVVLDETQAVASLAFGLLDSVAQDVANATGLSSLVGSSTISAAVTGVAAAVSNVQAGVPNTTNALAGVTAVAEGPLVSSLQSAITGAQSATQAQISATNASVNTAPVVAGGSPAAMASALSNTAGAFSSLNNLYQLSSTLSRMGVNTANIGQ